MKKTMLAILSVAMLAGCTSTSGDPVDSGTLGYKECEEYYDCGPGRYCTDESRCWADCRSSADCDLLGEGLLCNSFGECLHPDGQRRCNSHADCGPGRYCNGTCTDSGYYCGSTEECPTEVYAYDQCEGICGGHCGSDNDCLQYEEKELTCSPVGQCLQLGWEKWISPGELPPTNCTMDDQCVMLGWAWYCDCEKETHRAGYEVCAGGGESVCVEDPARLTFGDGPASSPASAFKGTWAMRMVTGVVTSGLPLVDYQNTASTNLYLLKINHHEGDTLVIEERICEILLLNFINSDEPFADLAWMLIPVKYLRSLPLLSRTVEVPDGTPGSDWVTSKTTDVRGCILDNPTSDPLPTRFDYDDNPNDPRLYDQDKDGNVAVTTLMDGVLRGEIYNVQRWSAIYPGKIIDADHVRGHSIIENEQFIISASKPELIYDTQTSIHTDVDRTYFHLTRMPDDTSCAKVIREGHLDNSWLRKLAHQVHCDNDSDCSSGQACKYGICFDPPHPP